ncbi:MAG: GntR family transcriptional regulator [Myxococcota bacterium]
MARLAISLSEASGVPFYRQIVDQVADLVRGGQLSAGEQLPSFRDLASELLVSLITVRRAYSELQAAGLVVRKQGQGTFVAPSVRAASRADIRKRAREAIAAGLAHARQLGMTVPELSKLANELLTQMEKHDDRRNTG